METYMANNRQQAILRLHELASSLNIAFALTALLFVPHLWPVTTALIRMDVTIHRWLWPLPSGVRVLKDSYTEGYFAFFVPAIAIAICLCVTFHLLSGSALVQRFFKSGAGIIALIGAPVWWLCFTYMGTRRYEWNPLTTIHLYEVLLMLGLSIFYLSARRFIPAWTFMALVTFHYGFWFWQFGLRPYFMGYGGPVGPSIGLAACLTWLLYLQGVRSAQSRSRT